MIDVGPEELRLIENLLRTHVPAAEVRAFGSRIKGTAAVHSDLDLAILAPSPLPLSTLGDLTEAFQESNLPFSVDLVDWQTITPSFRQFIEQQFVVVQSGGDVA